MIKTSNISANIFSLTLSATAFVDLMNSFASSNTAIDSFVVGKSVAEGFRLFVNSPGTARVEIVGTKNDGSLPISHYWITNSTDEDFGVRVSNFNSNNNVIKTKTQITQRSFEINLSQGVNNVVFKTSALRNLIPNGAKVGLKITLANGVSFTSTYSALSDSVDVADKIVVANTWFSGFTLASNTESGTTSKFGTFNIYPTNADYSFQNNFPKIMSMGASTEYYVNKYPQLDFTNRNNPSYYVTLFDGIKSPSIKVPNQTSKYTNNTIVVNVNYQLKAGLTDVSNQRADANLYVNIYNNGSDFNPGAAGLDPAKKGWKFYGNPEVELYETINGAGWRSATQVIDPINTKRIQ